MKKAVFLIACLLGLIFYLQATPLSVGNRSWRLTEVCHQFDGSGTGNYQNSTKHELVYHPSQTTRFDYVNTYSWDEPTLSWFRTEYQTISWNDTGNYPLLIQKYFQPGFPAYCRLTRAYDTQQRLVQNTCEMFYNEIWVLTSRCDYTYENNLLMGSMDYQYEQLSNTGLFIRKVFAHDDQGRIIGEDRFLSEDSTHWEIDSHTNWLYHSEDNTTGDDYIIRLSHYDIASYIYDIQNTGMILEMNRQAMYDSVYVDAERTQCTYDDFNRLLTATNQNFTDNWTNADKSTYEYDFYGNLQTISKQNWSTDINGWDPVTEVITLTWQQATANDDNVITPITMSLNTYPNPFKDNLNISFQSKSKAPIETNIYNLKGQLVKALGTSKSNSLNWDGKDKDGRAVSNGIYFVKAEQDGKTLTAKTVKL